MSYRKAMKEALYLADVEDLDGHWTGACEQSFEQGAVWGFKYAVELIRNMPSIRNERDTFGKELASWLEDRFNQSQE